MWLEKTIDLYRDFLENWFKDNNITDYEETRKGLPVFCQRWLYCMFKLGKNDVDCAVEYLKEIEPFLKGSSQKHINEVISSAHNYVQNGKMAEINLYVKKYLKK